MTDNNIIFGQDNVLVQGFTTSLIPEETTNFLNIASSESAGTDFLTDIDIFVEPEPLEGDADRDRDIDLDDVRAVIAGINTDISGDNDPRDINGDGQITVLDARQLVITVRSNTDQNAPELSANLLNDTAPEGLFNTDGITFAPALTGTIFDDSDITSLKIGINSTEELTEIIGAVEADGSFSITLENLRLWGYLLVVE